MTDLVIRNGTVVDGTGAPARRADVAVDRGRIVEVGDAVGRGDREVEADGHLVLPGWVDIHTHYDGQATWDSELGPSSWHGVTTTVFGNCSVGFAPVRPGCEPFLINLMEGVEDIPGSALTEGIDFCWESFPEYLDALASRQRTMDVGAQIPHAALRFYVMGDRGADHEEEPTPDEIAEMGALVQEALAAGALGFTTSRTKKHRAADGRFTPGLTAGEPELLGIAEAMGVAGRGVIQGNSDYASPAEFAILRKMAEVSGRPVSFSLLQVDHDPQNYRRLLDELERANREGLVMKGQVGSRPIGVIMGLQASIHPFVGHRSFKALGDGVPLEELVARLRSEDVRRAILDERPAGGFATWMAHALTKTFELGDPPDYEPDPARSIAAVAAAAGRTPEEHVYDLLLGDEGRALLYYPFENYSTGDLEPVREMLAHEHTVAGLSDGGAHVGTVCDASFPTYLLTHWVRDRRRGERLPLEHVVARQTSATARAVGLSDRGVVAPGFRADLNVVDLEGLRLEPPRLVHDLPAGGKRLVQGVAGYRHTFVAGVETYADGTWTGATPGRLLRGA